MRIAHIITGLGQGGAESLLVDLIPELASLGWTSAVCGLRSGGIHVERLRQQSVPVITLGMERPQKMLGAWGRCAKWLEDVRPAVIHTWLYHADLFGGLLGRVQRDVKVVWSLHNGIPDPRTRLPTRLVMRTCAKIAPFVPHRIVSCSETGFQWHLGQGYPLEKMSKIENGFPTHRFQFDEASRHSIRAEWGVAHDDVVFGLPARYAPAKDHSTFLMAAALVAQQRRHVRFLLCGRDITPNPALEREIRRHGLRDRVFQFGVQADMPRVYSGMDVMCSSSAAGEAFPMVLGEALSCGVPCVATRAGDSERIIGEAGFVVPVGDPEALARAMIRLADAGPTQRAKLGQRGRARMAAEFSLATCASRYDALYRTLM